jgi:hypothetical protein
MRDLHACRASFTCKAARALRTMVYPADEQGSPPGIAAQKVDSWSL